MRRPAGAQEQPPGVQSVQLREAQLQRCPLSGAPWRRQRGGSSRRATLKQQPGRPARLGVQPQHNRKSKYLSSLQQCLVLAVIVLQNIVDLTETNTQLAPGDIPLGLRSRLARRELAPVDTQNHGPDEDRMSQQASAASKRREFKISPTRIRLSNEKRYWVASFPGRLSRKNTSKHQQQLGGEDSPRAPVSPRPLAAGGRGRRLVPAYEFIPPPTALDDDDTINRVKLASFEGPKWTAAELEQVKANLSASRLSLASGLPRNELPKPELSSETTIRATLMPTERGHLGAHKRKIKRDDQGDGEANGLEEDQQQQQQQQQPGQEDEIEENPNEQMSLKNSSDNSNGDADYEPEPTADEREDDGQPLPAAASPASGLEPVDDVNVMARAGSVRRLTVSPIYPPGDLDILYSDALLVYVKDFNQYIKRR